MDFKSLNLSDFVRYILAGFNFIFFIVVLPFAYMQPNIIKDLLTESSFLTISISSIAVGYLLDILRVYQLTPNYMANRVQFMKTVADILDVPQDQASNYFSLTAKLWKKYSSYDLERQQSEWVLTLQTAVIFALSVFIWLAIGIGVYFQYGANQQIAIPMSAAILCLLLSIRLIRIADGTRKKANRDFIIILKKNKAKILDGWKMEDKQDLS